MAKLKVMMLLLAAATAAFGATTTVKFGSAMDVEIDGVVHSFAKDDTFTPTAIPCIYKMRMGGLAEGGRTFAIKGNDTDYYRFPQYGDDGWIRVALDPYPEADTNVTLTAYKVSNVYYVDAKNGSASYDGTAATHEEGTDHGPKGSLQEAHDVAVSGSTSTGFPVVFVAPGFYTNDSVVATYHSATYGDSSSKRRLSTTKNIAFIATEGPEKTFIIGEPDPNTADGFGDDAVSGVFMTSPSCAACLQGFTITGCYSPATQTGLGNYGTGVAATGGRAYCLDCIISNNYAAVIYPASSYGTFQRVRFIENKSPGRLTYYGTFISCIFAGNRNTHGNGNGTDDCYHHYTASFFCTYDLGDADYPNGRRRLNTASGSSKIHSALIYKMPNPDTNQQSLWHCTYVIDDPGFADAAGRDYRLGAHSPAQDKNSYETDLCDLERRFMTSDVDGRMPTLHDGMMRLGAVWNEPSAWYVAQNGGSDANDGTSPTRAKATIKAAMALAIDGDTIRVAPGTYGAAEGTQTATSKVAARVVVKVGVTLESTDGATNTFIVGAAATGDQIDNVTYGTGTNAVRCVYAQSDAVVRGFTLTGGRGVGAGDYSNNGNGAAFLSATARTATLEDCIVSNNASYRGVIFQAVVKRCRVLENVGVRTDNVSASAGSSCSWYNCIIDKNRGSGTVQGAYAFENCTIGTNNVDHTGGSPQVLYWWGGGDHAVINSVVLGGRYYAGGDAKLYCTNCLVMANQIGSALKREQSYNTIFTNSAAMKVDSEYRPKLGEFVGIDAGDTAYSSDALGDRDFYGTPRILNGQIDIGAVEYDWRPTFNAELGRRFTMTYASPTVTTNATGGVKLVGDVGALGERALPVCIVGTATSAGPYAFTFALAGGSAAVYVGGELAGEATGTGEQAIRFKVPDAAAEIRFVFTADTQNAGAAILRKFAGARGFTASFR